MSWHEEAAQVSTQQETPAVPRPARASNGFECEIVKSYSLDGREVVRVADDRGISIRGCVFYGRGIAAVLQGLLTEAVERGLVNATATVEDAQHHLDLVIGGASPLMCPF